MEAVLEQTNSGGVWEGKKSTTIDGRAREVERRGLRMRRRRKHET